MLRRSESGQQTITSSTANAGRCEQIDGARPGDPAERYRPAEPAAHRVSGLCTDRCFASAGYGGTQHPGHWKHHLNALDGIMKKTDKAIRHPYAE